MCIDNVRTNGTHGTVQAGDVVHDHAVEGIDPALRQLLWDQEYRNITRVRGLCVGLCVCVHARVRAHARGHVFVEGKRGMEWHAPAAVGPGAPSPAWWWWGGC